MAALRRKVTLHAPVGEAKVSNRGLQEIADEHLEGLVDAAFAAGREEGLAASLESGRELLEAAAERLDIARAQAETDLPRVAVELAIEVARQLLKIEIHGQNYDLERIVRGSLADSGVGRGECVVHVAIKDAERLEGVPWRSGTVVEADPSMDPGDVHITTPSGLLVREMDLALDAIREQLWEELA